MQQNMGISKLVLS